MTAQNEEARKQLHRFLYFADKQVSIAGRHYQLKSKPQVERMIRRVTLREDVIVPAMSELNLSTKIMCRSLQMYPMIKSNGARNRPKYRSECLCPVRLFRRDVQVSRRKQQSKTGLLARRAGGDTSTQRNRS